MGDSLKWTLEISVGDGAIDQEHAEEFELFNRARNAVEAGRPIDLIKADLFRHITIHFRNEEALMDELNLDESAKELHKAQHREFFLRSTEMSSRSDAEFVEFLRQWLIDHIVNGPDRNLARSSS